MGWEIPERREKGLDEAGEEGLEAEAEEDPEEEDEEDLVEGEAEALEDEPKEPGQRNSGKAKTSTVATSAFW